MPAQLTGYSLYVKPLVILRFGDKSGEDVLESMLSLKFEGSDIKASVLTLELVDRDGKLQEDSRLNVNKPLSVRLGYSTLMMKEVSLIIKEIHPVYPETGELKLTIRAFDLSVASKENTVPKNWGRATSDQIATAIANRYGYDTDIDPTKDIPSRDRIQPGKLTDMDYLRRLAVRINWDCYLDGTTLKFKPRDFVGNPVFRFEYRGANAGVLRNFTPHVKGWHPPQPSLAGVNDQSKKKISGITSDSGTKKSGTTVQSFDGGKLQSVGGIKVITTDGDKAPPTPTPIGDFISGVASGLGVSKVMSTPEPDQGKLNENLKGKMGSKEDRQYDASALLVGYPTVSVRDLVRIEGVARKWAGNYRIGEFLHDINANTFTTHLKLRKNALGPNAGDVVPKSGQANQGTGGSGDKVKVGIVNGASLNVVGSRTQ